MPGTAHFRAARADAAYDYAAGTTVFGRASFAWVYSACRGTVIDRGPQARHPATPRKATPLTAGVWPQRSPHGTPSWDAEDMQ
jgi:hypothetical protein